MANEGSFEAALKRSNEIRADFDVNPGKYVMLTGDRPTGRLHIGHYFGTLKGRVELQNRGVKTNIIIAHRISTLQDADKIIVIDGGRIAEEGTHQQLVDKGGIYADMYHSQLLEKMKKEEYAL